MLALITIVIFALGFWSARTRIRQLGNQALDGRTKTFIGIMGAILVVGVYSLVQSPGLPVLIAEFFALCAGQCLGYVVSGKKQ